MTPTPNEWEDMSDYIVQCAGLPDQFRPIGRGPCGNTFHYGSSLQMFRMASRIQPVTGAGPRRYSNGSQGR